MRYDDITIAKAIAIILMVMLHAGCPFPEVNSFVALFHMPLFFFCSGYCFKPSAIITLQMYLKKKIKGIYYPFVKWCTLFLLLHNTFISIHIYSTECGPNEFPTHLYHWKDMIKTLGKIVLTMHGQEELLGGYWFLHELFFASLLLFFVLKYLRNVKALYLLGGLALLITTTRFFNLHLPYYGDLSLTLLSLYFCLTGYYYHTVKDYNQARHTLLFVLIAFALSFTPIATSMRSYTVWQVMPYCIIAPLSIIAVLKMSKWLSTRTFMGKALLLYIGEHTLTILTWHFLIFKLVSLARIAIENKDIKQLAAFPVLPDTYWSFIPYTLVGVFLPITIQYMFEYSHKILTAKLGVKP